MAASQLFHVVAHSALAMLLVASGTAQGAQLNAQVSLPGGQPLGDAVVSATLLGATPPAQPRREISIEQKDKQFSPLVSVAQTGTLVNFPNRDPFRHHVYSFSPAKTFEIKLYSGVPAKPVMFDKPGEVVLGCNIHDTMVAHVLIVDTPFFAKTDAQGRAVLDSLPAGEYEIRLWYPGGAGLPPPQKRRLAATDSEPVTFRFAGKPLSPAPK